MTRSTTIISTTNNANHNRHWLRILRTSTTGRGTCKKNERRILVWIVCLSWIRFGIIDWNQWEPSSPDDSCSYNNHNSNNNNNNNKNNATRDVAAFGPSTLTAKTTNGSTNMDGMMLERSQQQQLYEFNDTYVRAFPTWMEIHGSDMPLPCFPVETDWQSKEVHQSSTSTGLWFIKTHKTASSTMVGIHLRIARNVALRRRRHQQRHNQSEDRMMQLDDKHDDIDDDIGGNNRTSFRQDKKTNTLNTNTTNEHSAVLGCQSRFRHGPLDIGGAAYRQFHYRPVRHNTFLWTILRDPTTRYVSQFFHFHVSRGKKEPSDHNFRSYLDQYAGTDYYLQQLSTRARYGSGSIGQDPNQVIHDIINDYDFIGITERADESIVALQMILDVPTADVLYLKSKGRGGYDDAAHPQPGICVYIWPSFITTGMRQYFVSMEWQDKIRYESLLYHVANASLDRTIDHLGREQFGMRLKQFQHYQRLVQAACHDRATFPCNEGGNYTLETDCLWSDTGCGTMCLDEFATNYSLW